MNMHTGEVGSVGSWWSARAAGLAPALLTVAIALAAVPVFYPYLATTDAYVYLAAGERLNAGHDLYALAPGDRVIANNPPYWDVPTLSPPLLAVLWRPLALLGTNGMLLGWALSGVAFLLALAILGARAGPWAIAGVAILAAPVGIQLGLGNVNGFIVLGLVAAWLWRDRPGRLGAILALMAMVKVTPLILVLWLIVTRRGRALAWFAVAGLVLLAVSVLGAGVSAHLEYFRVVAHTSTIGSSDLSLAGLARSAGLAPNVASLAPWVALVVGSTAMILARRRPAIAFGVAVTLIVFGSPVVQAYWLALLIAVLSPVTWSGGIRSFVKT